MLAQPIKAESSWSADTMAFDCLQVDYPESIEFDSSDTNVYFVKAGHVQLRAADKQLEQMQVRQTVAQAAVAVQTMAATGPLSKVALCLLLRPFGSDSALCLWPCQEQ